MSEVDPTLSEVVKIQAAFDIENFSGADTPEGKRRHVFLHLTKLIGKFGTIEEQADHGNLSTELLDAEIIPDLVVFAGQLAALQNRDLTELYVARLENVAERNGTGVESARRAFKAAE